MNAIKKPPVFCDHCSTLALAQLNDELLCEKCIFAAIEKNTELGTVKPLEFWDNFEAQF